MDKTFLSSLNRGLTILFLVFFLFAFSREGMTQSPMATVVEVEGSASLDRANLLSELKAGDELYPEDLIRTPEGGRVLIQWLSDLSLVKLAELSSLRICEEGDTGGCVFVTQGNIWGKKEKKSAPFSVKTSLATLGVRGTEFFVRLSPRAHELLIKEGRVLLVKEGVEAGDLTKVVFQPEQPPVFLGVDAGVVNEWSQAFS